MRTLFIALTLAFALPAFAEEGKGGHKASQNPDALAIDAACTAEAQTAGCGDAKVGTGLLKCIGAYKKAHRKEFKVSDGCKAAMQKAREDRKAKKDAKGGAEAHE